MTYNKRLLSVCVVAGILGLASCSDDDGGSNGGQLTKDEAKGKITSFNTTAKSDLQALQDIEGMRAVQDLFDLTNVDDPFGRTALADHKKLRSFFRQKGKDFKTVFTQGSTVARTADDGSFDYEANLGIYEWDAAKERFVMTDNASIIAILFPTEGSSTNNARLELTAYSEIQMYDAEYDEYYYVPELLTASLSVDDATVASAHLEIEWDDNGFPLQADITLSLPPFKLDVAFDTKSSTSNSLSVSLLRGQETVVATSVTVNYKNTSKSEESLKNIEGFVQLRDLKLQGMINVEAANNAGENVDLNDFVDLALYSNNQKLADVVFVDENDAAVAYLKYADGSQEKLETALQPVIDEIDAMTDDFREE